MTSITEELRDYAQASFGGEHHVVARPYLQAIEAIADRIDEEAKELCKNAFVSGTLYGTESIRYGTDAVAYNWDHWLKEYEDRFGPLDTWESIIYDAMQAGRTEETIDVTPLIDRCKVLCERTKEDS